MYLFGPVPSRRLGLSLGVDLLNCKSCNLNCVYCELGRTFQYTDARKIFVNAADVLKEIKDFFEKGGNADYITFSGAGEPTLAQNLGEVMDGARRITARKIALITNAVLFSDPQVRREAAKADVVLPSVDAVTEKVFTELNRPHPSVELKKYLEGLRQFTREYGGQVWVEVMMVKGINDSENDIIELRKYLDTLKHVDKIQINTVVRARAEKTAGPAGAEELKIIKGMLGVKAEIIGSFSGGKLETLDDLRGAVLSIIRLRPADMDGLKSVLPHDEEEIKKNLDSLVKEGLAEKLDMDGKSFYRGRI